MSPSLLTKLNAILITAFCSTLSFAQTDLEKAQNLARCLDGGYPMLCKRNWLTDDQLRKTDAAERKHNLATCLSGQYPALCDHTKLSDNEVPLVAAAEKRKNLQTCLTGKYRALCRRDLLSNDEAIRVKKAEDAENLRICLTGRFSSLCDHAALTDTQIEATRKAEMSQQSNRPRTTPVASGTLKYAPRGSSGCEDGHWVDSVMDDGTYVKLEDGSLWEVDAVDTVDSALWLPTSNIIACNYKLINTDDNESVEAHRIH